MYVFDETVIRMMEKERKLGELHEAGTLTDTEFETAKQKILRI